MPRTAGSVGRQELKHPRTSDSLSGGGGCGGTKLGRRKATELRRANNATTPSAAASGTLEYMHLDEYMKGEVGRAVVTRQHNRVIVPLFANLVIVPFLKNMLCSMARLQVICPCTAPAGATPKLCSLRVRVSCAHGSDTHL